MRKLNRHKDFAYLAYLGILQNAVHLHDKGGSERPSISIETVIKVEETSLAVGVFKTLNVYRCPW